MNWNVALLNYGRTQEKKKEFCCDLYCSTLGGDPMTAGRISFIILNQAAGRSKFDRGPDLARGPDHLRQSPPA